MAVKARDSGLAINREIGLWATPATWKQKYPNVALESLPSVAVGELMGKGWTLVHNYFGSSVSLLK